MSSLDFAWEVEKISNELTTLGYKVSIPFTIEKIINRKMSLKNVLKHKKQNDFFIYTRDNDLIKRNFDRINQANAVLILNLDKNGIKNYIGGNTFLEIGLAHVLGKKIFLYNQIPNMIYTDEIKAMNPTVINQQLNKIT